MSIFTGLFHIGPQDDNIAEIAPNHRILIASLFVRELPFLFALSHAKIGFQLLLDVVTSNGAATLLIKLVVFHLIIRGLRSYWLLWYGS